MIIVNGNLNAAGSFSLPGGYNFRLSQAGAGMVQGIVPASVASVSAVLACEKGTCNAHLALYTMPNATPVNGAASTLSADGALVVQTDLTGLGTTQQTITVTAPTGVQPVPYIVRLWIDSVSGFNAETISRDGSTLAANLPSIPTGVLVYSMTVA